MTERKRPSGLEMVVSPEDISKMVKGLAKEMDRDYGALLAPGERLLAMGVLNGAFVFMADLIRELGVPVEVDFIRLSSYRDGTSSSEHVVMLKAPERDLKGRHVLLVEDLADCGLTINWLKGFILTKEPASVRVAVAVDKVERRHFELALDYVGVVLEEGFLVGYGLDYAQEYRNLKGIYKLVF